MEIQLNRVLIELFKSFSPEATSIVDLLISAPDSNENIAKIFRTDPIHLSCLPKLSIKIAI